MNGLEAAGNKLKKKKKLAFSDYDKPSQEKKVQTDAKEVKQEAKPTGESAASASIEKLRKKNYRTSLILPGEEYQMLTEMYTTRLLNGEKIDKATLIRKGIRLLYEKEKGDD